jgi:alkylation response protein AidB-like acyl-CoA dehydrogenase
MRFELSEEQRGFASSLADLLGATDVVATARGWAAGDTAGGLRLWTRLADQGVCALVVPEEAGGMGGTPADLVVAFEQLGRFAVPGPWVESAAYLPVLLGASAPEVVEALAEGAVGSVLVAEHAPCALDADAASHLYLVGADGVSRATVGDAHRSVDPARRLFDVTAGEAVDVAPVDVDRAFDLAALACSAQQLGLAEHLLATTVDYVKQRRQFGREIGSYQALKHRLADVRIALDFVRPLVLGAALTFDTDHRAQDVSAAKVAASDGGYLAARTALQLHGAIGYTEEHDLSLWLLKARALVTAWGTPAHHRARLLDALGAAEAGHDG